MSATLTYDSLFPQVSASSKTDLGVSSVDNVANEPDFFVRLLEALGSALYVQTGNGKRVYLSPPGW